MKAKSVNDTYGLERFQIAVGNNTNYNDDYKSKFRKIFLIFYHLETKIDDEGKSIEIRIMQLEILVLLKQMLYNQPILVLKILYEIEQNFKKYCLEGSGNH